MEDPNGIERFRGVMAGRIVDTARCSIPGCGKYVSPVWNDVCNEHEIERIDLYKGPEREMWLVVMQLFGTLEKTYTYETVYTPAHSYNEAVARAFEQLKRRYDLDAYSYSRRPIVIERIPISGDWTIDGADFHMNVRLDRDVIYPDEVVNPEGAA